MMLFCDWAELRDPHNKHTAAATILKTNTRLARRWILCIGTSGLATESNSNACVAASQLIKNFREPSAAGVAFGPPTRSLAASDVMAVCVAFAEATRGLQRRFRLGRGESPLSYFLRRRCGDGFTGVSDRAGLRAENARGGR